MYVGCGGILISCLCTQLRDSKQTAITAATPEKMSAFGTYLCVKLFVDKYILYGYTYIACIIVSLNGMLVL